MKTRLLILCLVLIGLRAGAYGSDGHELIGAIADARLAGTATAGNISALLDGITLERAATLPDEIRSWDKRPNEVILADHPKIAAQLRAFHTANDRNPTAPTNRPSHGWFHYTDVPLEGGEKYGDGTEGRSEWDLVHMIPYCAGVLDGSISADNERKITKPVAIILLAHYVGDIHQPLHVGAQFFGTDKKPVQPDGKVVALEDRGGNAFNILFRPDASAGGTTSTNFHGFWDVTAALRAIEQTKKYYAAAHRDRTNEATKAELGAFLATSEPANWKLDVPVSALSTNWANEIMPLSREAHARLDFSDIKIYGSDDRRRLGGSISETPQPDGLSYLDWSARAVRSEMQKAGWRLADLLKRALN